MKTAKQLFQRIKKAIAKVLLRLLGFDYRVRLKHKYWPRMDTVSTIDLMLANPIQQEGFEVTLSDGSKIFGQWGHYIDEAL